MSRRECLRKPREERARGFLVATVGVAAGAEALFFGHGDAGDAQEQVEDAGGADDREPAPRRGEGEDEEGDPDEPFEEVIGMAAPPPEPAITNPAAVGGIALERRELRVGAGPLGHSPHEAGALGGGRGLFEGTVSEARSLLPIRITLETAEASPTLEILPGVHSMEAQSSNRWRLELEPGASASAVLEACFERSLRLRCFDVQDPDLHEVFVHLVGPSAREAALR